MLATVKAASPKTQKCLKPHGISGFRHYGANRYCIKDGVNIDPPYNTGAAFEYYNDIFPHPDWLSMMYPRLEILREFLSDDRAIFISINFRDEYYYLRIICDYIFERKNF